MKRQNDGKIIIGGTFTTYATIPALNVTRIFPSANSLEAKTSTNFYEAEPDVTDIDSGEVINLYPNPTTGLLYISSKDLSQRNIKITVYTVLGQKVFSQDMILNEVNELNFTSLKKNTYFVAFSDENRNITKTIIIK